MPALSCFHSKIEVRYRHTPRRFSCRSRASGRRTVVAAADPPSVSGFFRGLLGTRIRPADPVLQAAQGIRDAIASGAENEAVVGGFVDTLQSAVQPFDEQQIGGGPWQVIYSRGPLLWQGWQSPGKLVNIQNEASQDFRPNGRTVVNKAEVFGEKVFVTANGTYEPQGDTSTTPVDVLTSVTDATLHFFGNKIRLPIRGQGRFTIVYIDESLRLLRNGTKSTSGLVVQIRARVLRKLLKAQRAELED